MDTLNQDEPICRCSGTTSEQIVALINQGVKDFDSISRNTGACSGCGGCEFDVEQLIANSIG